MLFHTTQEEKFKRAKKLSDIMVPVETYIKHVRKIEVCEFFTPTIVKNTKDLYVMDYIYDTPVIPFAKEMKKYTDNMPDTAITSWLTDITTRCVGHLQYPCNKKDIFKLDQNQNIGMIVHKMIGLIVPFEYDKLKEIKYVTMPNYSEKRTDKNLVLTYSFNFGDYLHDQYNDQNNWVVANPFPINESSRDGLVNYIEQSIKTRNKIIMIP